MLRHLHLYVFYVHRRKNIVIRDIVGDTKLKFMYSYSKLVENIVEVGRAHLMTIFFINKLRSDLFLTCHNYKSYHWRQRERKLLINNLNNNEDI